MDYRRIIESRYDRCSWQELLYDIFGNKVRFWQQPQPVLVDEQMAKRALYTGKIDLPDGHVIAIYEVELSDSIIIERNRAGIRNLLLSSWRGMGCAGAFMFCFRQNEAVLRFSYVSESLSFAADGSLTKESTDTKRFTYLLGEGHRSRTAIMQFEELKRSALDLKAITKAFSVEALSDKFFAEYKKQYEGIIEFITGKRYVKVGSRWEEKASGEPCKQIMDEFSRFPDAEKAVRDYVKKLMGRLVFIQFLQKKGWMGCPAGEAWTGGDKEFVQTLFAKSTHQDTFVDDVLEPLFNDINTKRAGDIAGTILGVGIKIPYLNGGLFEEDAYDRTAFPLPAKYMRSMLDFLASYNFTIDENDPDDAEIGVDPEMLGRIFENLLEDNKDKGAFYTPKEIVQYMCRESLIAYLQADVADASSKDAIRRFVSTYDVSILSRQLKETIGQRLKEVKICDPAIGSGAFPMGLLRELYACRKALEGIDAQTAVRIKSHIIQNNIYGVDIEKGAVDIARLRFWLALIVDEKNPHALPNMDFKIMPGNSLLEQYEGIDLSGMSVNELARRKAKKGQAWEQRLVFDERDALENIQNAIREYYYTDDHSRKTSLRKIINSNVKDYILNLKGWTADLQTKLEQLPIPNNLFFLWHIYFKEVFDRGGFDIVIGNPPYIQLQDNGGELADIYQGKGFSTFERTGDIYCLFYEQAHRLLAPGGHACLITSNKWMRAGYGGKTRQFLGGANCHPRLLIDFAGTKVFESATVDVNILLYQHSANQGSTRACIFGRDASLDAEGIGKYVDTHAVDIRFSPDEAWVVLTPEQQSIKRKIEAVGTPLKDWNISINRGILTGYNPAFIISTDRRNEILAACSTDDERQRTEQLIRPVLRGRDIKRYGYQWAGLWLIGTHNGLKQKGIPRIDINDYPAVKAHLDQHWDKIKKRDDQGDTPYNLRNCAYWQDFDKEKIVWGNLNLTSSFTFVEDNPFFINAPSPMITPANHYFLGMLNSKVVDNYIRNLGVTRNGGYFEYKPMFVEKAPIPLPTNEQQAAISSLVRRVLDVKKAGGDTTSLEREIDVLVCDLYGLTAEERALIGVE